MRWKRALLLVGLAFVVLVGGFYGLNRLIRGPAGPIARATLADGRILQIEAVTYGTRHHVGHRSPIEALQPWLPAAVVRAFASPRPYTEITRGEPALVVWVNAIDPVTRSQVDCQQIRVEFIDEHGDLFGQQTSSWHHSPGFWRCGHIFQAFPRTQPTLTLQVTSWNAPGPPIRMQFPNPCLAKPASWPAQPLPQRVQVGQMEVELASLVMRTNGGPKQIYQTPGQYWEPAFKFRRDRKEVPGWDKPEWTAADPTGNRGQYLGIRQPVLRFSATIYPRATNLADCIVLGSLPTVTIEPAQSNAWSNVELTNGSAPITVLGLFPPATYVFSEGRFDTNPAVRMGPTQGGAPSGWVGQSRRVSPTQIRFWHGHYTPVPVVYMRVPPNSTKDRLGLRLRDEQGRYWLAKPEPEGSADGIWPFLLELPSEVKTVSAEVVLLRPVQVEFTVQTPKPASDSD